MKQKELFSLVTRFGKAYREKIGPLAVDMREALFDTSVLLNLDPKYLMRVLIEQRPNWDGVSKNAGQALDLAIRLMSAEDETIRTIKAKSSDETTVKNGIRLLGAWADKEFRSGLVHAAIDAARPFQRKLRDEYPDLDSEDLLFFLLEEFQNRLIAQPTHFKDSGLVEDILQKVLL